MQFLNENKTFELAKEQVGANINYRYQELGVKMQKDFKENIWWLFHKYHEDDIAYAYEQCKKYDKFSVGYLISIIKKRYGNR